MVTTLLHAHITETSLRCVLPPAPNSNSESCFRAVKLNLRRDALKTELNPWSAVSFNQSAQQVESLLKKKRDLHSAPAVAAQAQRSKGTVVIVRIYKKKRVPSLLTDRSQRASAVLLIGSHCPHRPGTLSQLFP